MKNINENLKSVNLWNVAGVQFFTHRDLRRFLKLMTILQIKNGYCIRWKYVFQKLKTVSETKIKNNAHYEMIFSRFSYVINTTSINDVLFYVFSNNSTKKAFVESC